MIEYRISHVTTYQYSEPVRVCHNLLLLSPRVSPTLECLAHRVVVKPTPQLLAERIDFFGNPMRAFSIEESHRQLTVGVHSHVRVHGGKRLELKQSEPWENVLAQIELRSDPHWLEAAKFCFDSARIRRSDLYRDYALKSFSPRRPILEATMDLTSRIFRDFKYDAQATTVDTPPETAFEIKRGVCQDFAQVQIACLRSIGIAARYVSGYLRTIAPPGQPRLIGSDQSHAWIAVYAGALGWVEFDPTNNCVVHEDHVPIAIGRDYQDVVPFRGVFLGGGTHTMSVSVDVIPLHVGAAHSREN